MPRRLNSLGVEADGLHEQVDPLVGGEPAARLEVVVEVELRQLDWLDRAEDPRHDALVVAVEVLDVADAPHAADQELGMRLDGRGLDDHALDAEVGELGLVDVGLLVEGDGDLVDDPVPAAFLDRRLDQFGLAPVDVVLGENLANSVDACLDGGLVVRCRVLTEEVLKDVRRHDRVALDGLDQVLADDDAGEQQVDLEVEVALLRAHRHRVAFVLGLAHPSHLLLRSRSPMRTSASACRSSWHRRATGWCWGCVPQGGTRRPGCCSRWHPG